MHFSIPRGGGRSKGARTPVPSAAAQERQRQIFVDLRVAGILVSFRPVLAFGDYLNSPTRAGVAQQLARRRFVCGIPPAFVKGWPPDLSVSAGM